MSHDLVLRSRHVLTDEGERPAAVCVSGGKIAAIEGYDFPGEDLGDVALLPGQVDPHVHVNEPGRTEWEGFATATRAAAAGGVTTIVDMPLNSLPPTVTVEALDAKRAAAAGQCHVDVGFWGGAVPGHLDDLPALHDAGVFGFKSFLVDSGVPEFPPLDAAGLADALGRVPALFVVHAELAAAIRPQAPSRAYRDFLASRPDEAETRAVSLLVETARRAKARVHVLHLSSAAALRPLERARRAGVRVTVETCPHYLTLAAEDVPDGATEYKCCPPIRGRDNREALWRGLARGAIDMVVSDHSPCPPALKAAGGLASGGLAAGDLASGALGAGALAPGAVTAGDLGGGDFAGAWGGISSLQIGLPLVWTHARARGYALADVVAWMARRPAEVAGLPAKGRIAVGCDADLVAFAPDEPVTVDPARLRHRHKLTPYAGMRLTGAVHTTWLRGVPVDGRPRGRLLTREAG